MTFARVVFGFAFVAISASPSFAETTKWGAIAVDAAVAEREPYYGVGGGGTEQEATDAAIGFCKEAGGAACKSVVTYQQCGALAVSGKGQGGWGTSDTKDGAEAQAMSACKSDVACKIVVSDCN